MSKQANTHTTPKKNHQFSSIDKINQMSFRTPKYANASPLHNNTSRQSSTRQAYNIYACNTPKKERRVNLYNVSPIILSSKYDQLASKLGEIFHVCKKLHQKALIASYVPSITYAREKPTRIHKSSSNISKTVRNDTNIAQAYEENVKLLKESESNKIKLLEKNNQIVQLQNSITAKNKALKDITAKYNESQYAINSLKITESTLNGSLLKYVEDSKIKEPLWNELMDAVNNYKSVIRQQDAQIEMLEKEKETLYVKLKEAEGKERTFRNEYVDNLAKVALSKDSLEVAIKILKGITKGKSQMLEESIVLQKAITLKYEEENKKVHESNKLLAKLCYDTYKALQDLDDEDIGYNMQIHKKLMSKNEPLFNSIIFGSPYSNKCERYWLQDKEVETDVTDADISLMYQRMKEMKKENEEAKALYFQNSVISPINNVNTSIVSYCRSENDTGPNTLSSLYGK